MGEQTKPHTFYFLGTVPPNRFSLPSSFDKHYSCMSWHYTYTHTQAHMCAHLLKFKHTLTQTKAKYNETYSILYVTAHFHVISSLPADLPSLMVCATSMNNGR